MKLDHLVILASDLQASAAWYGAVLGALGFAKTRDHVWLHPDGWALDLRPATDAGRAYGRYAPGLNHTGFRADSVAAVEALMADLAAAGVEVPAIQDFGHEKAVFLRDPDGMRFEVAAFAT